MPITVGTWQEQCFGHAWGGDGYLAVPILQEFSPYAVAFRNCLSCDQCNKDWFELEVGISPACSLNGMNFLDRMHDAEEVVKIGLSRGSAPWNVEIHKEIYHYPGKLWLPWLQFHFFGPFEWHDIERLSKLANTVIPWLSDQAAEIYSLTLSPARAARPDQGTGE